MPRNKSKDFGPVGKDLFASIEKNDIKKVCRMLSKNRDLTSASDEHHSPLSRAATLGHHEIVELLITEYAADISERYIVNAKWCLLLHLMSSESKPCNENHLKVGELLIEQGTNVNSYDFYEETPLLYAVRAGNVGWAKFLLKNGARLKGLEGKTGYDNPVYRMTYDESPKDMLILLVEHGLSPNLKTKYGTNFLHLFIDCCINAAAEVAEFLISRGVPVDERDSQGRTPLFRSVYYGNFKLASILIGKGADVNCKGKKNKQSLLHWTACRGHEADIGDLLLSNGADVHAKNKDEETPLHLACSNSNEEMIGLLIRRGANISAKDKKEKTPFSRMYFRSTYMESAMKVMVREFSKLSFENEPIFEKDFDLIQANPHVKEYFEKCLAELSQFSKTLFYGLHSYYSVLKMSKNVRKLSKLTQNEVFIKKFEANLSKFTYYKEDLKIAMEEAVKVRENFKASYVLLRPVFRNHLPDVVTRKLADYLTPKDLPLL